MEGEQVINDMMSECGRKPTLSSKDVLIKLGKLKDVLGMKKDVLPTSKAKTVDSVKKYDVVYIKFMGDPHYMLVHNVIGQCVNGVTFSSRDKCHNLDFEIKEDRFFKGSYVTKTYACVSLEEACNSFSRVYENKAEADEIFKKLKLHYKTVLKV